MTSISVVEKLNVALNQLDEATRRNIITRLIEHLFVFIRTELLQTEQERLLYDQVVVNSMTENLQGELIESVFEAKIQTLSPKRKIEVYRGLSEEFESKVEQLYISLLEN